MTPRQNDEGITTSEKMSAPAESTNTTPQVVAAATAEEEEAKPTCLQRMIKFYWDNEFVILVVIAILLARAYPPLGATYLAPQITATWIAVIFIFSTFVTLCCLCPIHDQNKMFGER